MKKFIFFLFAAFSLSIGINAQTPAASPSPASQTADAKPKRGPVFRANKEQVMQAQKMLKVTESGKLSDEDRAALKTWQSGNGLKATGTLNRATLEKMNIALTDKQKEIPVSPNSMAGAETVKASSDAKKRGPVFRANKEQITEVQTKLKTGGMYSGDATGKLDDPTREAVKKWQTANGVKATGTLNKETLEKMGIMLTDKQKAM